jgi:hypothetical protein
VIAAGVFALLAVAEDERRPIMIPESMKIPLMFLSCKNSKSSPKKFVVRIQSCPFVAPSRETCTGKRTIPTWSLGHKVNDAEGHLRSRLPQIADPRLQHAIRVCQPDVTHLHGLVRQRIEPQGVRWQFHNMRQAISDRIVNNVGHCVAPKRLNFVQYAVAEWAHLGKGSRGRR